MSLREAYETLRRRGMPEHPSIHFERCKEKDPWIVDYRKAGVVAEGSDARDIITMHALRWLTSLSHFGSNSGFSVIEINGSVSLHWIPKGEREPHKEVGHKTILDAIVAATAFMEKK